MNIFVLDLCPVKAAQYQCDRHVVKMVLETAQLLCTAFDDAPYKKTHVNHPCAVWTRAARGNYEWLVSHGIALANEYKQRYGKTHRSLDTILWCNDNVHKVNTFTQAINTPFAQAMPDQYKDANPVLAYRRYYVTDKARIARWKHGNIPDWFTKGLHGQDVL